MCKGLALGFNYKKGVVCKGLSHHTETLKNEEDDFLKLELMISDNKDGYILEIDEQYSKDKEHKFKEMVTKQGKLKKEVKKIVMKHIKDNELQFVKWLLKNQTYKQISENLNQYFCEAGENLDQSSCEAGENLYQYSCKADKDLYQDSCKAGKTLYNHNCKAKKMTVQYIKVKDKKTTEFIKMLSDKAEDNVLYMKDLVKWAIKGYKK